jgi:hypothetical protein
MTKAIIMLTKDDSTVSDAVKVFHSIKNMGISCIGFKDKGLSPEGIKELVRLIRKENMEIYFEIVSETKDATLESAERAMELGVDYLIGGKYIRDVLGIIKNRIKYYPYVGEIVGHPCLLRGEPGEMIAEAKEFESLGIDGINLLAYRYNGDVSQLIPTLQKAVNLPLIIAGNIDSLEKIRFITKLNISAFTMGTALFNKKFAPGGSLNAQIECVLKETNQ